MNEFFQALACVGAPVDCGIGWLDSLPVLVVILVSVGLGMLIGAHAGKPATYAVLTGGVALFFIGRRSHDTNELDDDTPPHPMRRSSQKPPPGKRVRTIQDMFGKWRL